MMKLLLSGLAVFFALVCFSGCSDSEDTKPAVVPFPVDTASADQYLVCNIDTIQYIAYSKNGAPNEIRMTTNTDEVTKFFSQAQVLRSGQPLTRNLELFLYKFKERRFGNYIGAQIFANSRTDVLVNRVDIEEKNWTIFNAPTNQIQVYYADSTIARGTFNFKMQNVVNPSQFLEVTNGAFKVRLK